MSQDIIDKMFAAMEKTKGVPAFEGTVSGILASLRGAQKETGNLASQISEDFSMTQKVLKLANSAMYAPFAQGISSVSEAVDVLGGDALLHLALGAPMVSAAELKEDASLSRTLLASELARTVSTQRTEDVSVAALMFDLGNLMAYRFLPDEFAAIDRKVGAGATADDAAREILGMSMRELGVRVATRWGLPAEIVSIIDGTGDETLVEIARFSTQASSLAHRGDAASISRLVAELEISGIDKAQVSSLVSRKLNEMFAVEEPVRDESPASLLGALHATLSTEKKDTVDKLAYTMFAQLSGVLHTTHCLLFMAIKSGDFLVRCGQGKGIDELKSKLRICAEFKPTAFHAAIKNNADVVIADVTKLNPAALPEGYSALLPNVASFIILPIANAQVSGLLYLDWESPYELHTSTLTALRQLRDLFPVFFPR